MLAAIPVYWTFGWSTFDFGLFAGFVILVIGYVAARFAARPQASTLKPPVLAILSSQARLTHAVTAFPPPDHQEAKALLCARHRPPARHRRGVEPAAVRNR